MSGAPTTTEPAPAVVNREGGAGVEVSGLVRRYGEREALAGVGFSIARGETLAVFGANGAGKTTLLRVLATLLRPHAGTVRVLGRELPRDAHAVRGSIGFVGHEPLLYRDLSPGENLAFYSRLYGIADSGDRISALLAAIGMERRAADPVRSLSRGMVQRVAVARAVLHCPELLLLDEPRAGLDAAAAALIDALIGPSPSTTRVLVTHDVEGGLAEASMAVCLRAGRVALAERAGVVDPDSIRREIR